MAFVDDNYWGLGVYNRTCTHISAELLGSPGGEAHDVYTSYIVPVEKVKLPKDTVYMSTYYLVIGDTAEIRSAIYTLQGDTLNAGAPQQIASAPKQTKTILPIQKEENRNIDIYPNPASGKSVTLAIKNKSLKNYTLNVFKTDGLLLYSDTINSASYQLNISSLKAGVYLIQIKNKEGVVSARGKLIIK